MIDPEHTSAERVALANQQLRRHPSGASLQRLAAALSATRMRASGGRVRAIWHKHGLWLIAGLAVLAVLAGLALLSSPFGPAHALLIAAAGLMMLVLHRANVGGEARPSAAGTDKNNHRFEDLCDTLERRVEQLQDVHWEISERDIRYRDLLDQQRDVILRSDDTGKLTFVNTSFSRVFGIDAQDALGQTFAPRVVDTTRPPPLDLGVLERGGRHMELVETVLGQRWYVWDEHEVVANDGTRTEVQVVGRDVTEECNRAAELADARDQALSANRAKSRFLAAMSHEIRTPMNGIMGMASLLCETELSDEQRTYVTAVDQSARVLLALIDEILDFSKIEAGKFVLIEAPFNLAQTAQSVVELLSPRAHDKGLELALTIDPSLESMFIGDEARVRQILLNLLSNAVKFTNHGGISVSITAHRDEENSGQAMVKIAVEDTGIGLSGADMQRLFLEFEQVDTLQRRNQGGTGLGLAISKRLTRAMNGDIKVTSTLGRGSAFEAQIVLRRSGDQEHSDTADIPALNEKLHVLLAMDHAIERSSIAHILKSAGHDVIESETEDAKSNIKTAAEAGHPVDRVIVDVSCDPGAAREILKAAHQAASTPVIGIVTVNVLARSGLTAFRNEGYQRYLIRPVRARSLLRQLSGGRQGADSPASSSENAADSSNISSTADAVSSVDEGMDLAVARRILLVEDNDINALLAGRVLEKCGCMVERRDDGPSGVECAIESFDGKRPKFDLILMDIYLPGMDGIEAARAIRDARSKQIVARGSAVPPCPPIIALTANAFPEDRERCLSAGLDDYLAKPFDQRDLQALLQKWAA